MSKKYKKIDLRECENTGCVRNCNKVDRRASTDDGICNLTTSADDSMIVRCVGSWAYEKISHLVKYFDIFASGMKYKWEGNISYLEICSGPGRCILREKGVEIDGTALAIMGTTSFDYLKKAIFIDRNKEAINCLNKRIENAGLDGKATGVVADYKATSIYDVLDLMPDKCLNLVFVDPTDCSVPFTTLKRIKDKLEKVDLIVNVAFGTDLKRNIVDSILDDNFHRARDKYISFLGSEEFFYRKNIRDLALKNALDDLMVHFFQEYEKTLNSIGFEAFKRTRVEHYYDLLFATSDETGLDFWKKAQKIRPDGQRTFGF